MIRTAGLLLPDADAPWVESISAELCTIASTRERASFALSSIRGVLMIAAERQAQRWFADAPTLAVAVALGVFTASIDVLSESRWPLRLGLLSSCAVVGFAAPRVARTCGVLIGVGLPILTSLSGFRGPYEIDRADVWWPILPAIIVASAFGWLRSRRGSRA